MLPGLERALALGLRWKILLANAALVSGAIVVGSAAGGGESAPGRLALAVVGGAALSLPVNAALVGAALRPLRDLERTAKRVAEGDLAARAPLSPLAGAPFRGLVATFNRMLDRLETLEGRLRGLAQRATDSAEEERQTLALRLREDTAQALAVALLGLKRAAGLDDAEERAKELARVRRSVTAAIDGSRNIAAALRPPGLDVLGLRGALSALVRRVGEGVPVAFQLQISDHAPATPRAELALYRAGEEAVSNAVRHANASEVTIRLGSSGDDLVLEVADDGVGFQPDPIRDRGLGLMWIEQRASALGGRATIDSAPGRGTRVRVTVPRSEGGDG